MKTKTIKTILKSKMEHWLESISDEKLRESVKNNILISGGSIASLFLNEPVNDYDIYIQDMDVLVSLAEYYCPGKVLDGRKKNNIIEDYMKKVENGYSWEDNESEEAIRYKTLKEDQVKLNIASQGIRYELTEEQENDPNDYSVVFLSQNAVSLNNDIQIVLRFNGDSEQIHKTFDFMHATNYFTFEEGLVTNKSALESLLSKDLKYQGSLYPLTSIIRMKKFIKRGWNIGAGEILKIMFQISELDLTDPEVLEEQLIGVDVAYFSKLIDILRGVPKDKIVSSYLNTIIDRVFENHEE